MARRPNVVVFLTDQQRHDSCGHHGNPLDLTPNLDYMARRGTDFHQAITCQPVCGPARSCLQTGRYATDSGCWANGIPLPNEMDSLGKRFKAAGYRTGYVGKWHLANKNNVPPEDRHGYDFWVGGNAIEGCSDAYDTQLWDTDMNPVKLPGYRVDAQTDVAIRFIDEMQDEPFMLFISYLEPHFQNHRDDYPAPFGYEQRYIDGWTPPDLAALGGSSARHLPGYWGMCRRLDEAYGRLHDALYSLGLSDDTVTLFTSDHGCHFKTRNAEYKRSCHESSVHVPMVFTGPGFDEGKLVDRPVSLVDVAPTLCDAAGIDAPEGCQGRSLLNMNEYPDDVLIQVSEESCARAIRTKRWKYCVTAEGVNGWKQGSADRYTESHLYDLMADPWELNNLVGYESHAEVCSRMRERVLDKMAEAGEEAPELIPATPVKSGQKSVLDGEVDA